MEHIGANMLETVKTSVQAKISYKKRRMDFVLLILWPLTETMGNTRLCLGQMFVHINNGNESFVGF